MQQIVSYVYDAWGNLLYRTNTQEVPSIVKKSIIVLIIIAVILFVWLSFVLYANILTANHAEEFRDTKAMQYNFLHAWDPSDYDLRVLSYSDSQATVYYFSECGGEKARFVKNSDAWIFDEILAIWSKQGSADDIFIWPYFKHYVP